MPKGARAGGIRRPLGEGGPRRSHHAWGVDARKERAGDAAQAERVGELRHLRPIALLGSDR